MAALAGFQIRDRLQSADLERRLVVSPLLEPEEQIRDDQASIDIRLGFEFALIAPSAYGTVDEFAVESVDTPPLSSLYQQVYVPFGGSIVVHPHQFILAATLEYVRLPKDMIGYVLSRSTWGRLGLIVATAVGVQPSFAGTLTLELRNLGETPLRLYPGQAIAQLFFHEVAAKDMDEGGLGQYSGAVDLLPKKMSAPKTYQKIAALRSERS